MPRKKPEETPDERIERLRTQLEPSDYVRRLHADLTAIVNELFFVDEKLDAEISGTAIPESIIPTEHLTIVGFQHFDEDGLRGGDVRLILRDGSMPYWFARGLLDQARSRVEQKSWEATYADPG